MIERKVSKTFINIILNWYQKLFGIVRWKDTESNMFKINSGVRQGILLSTLLFNFYVNDIIMKAVEKLDKDVI